MGASAFLVGFAYVPGVRAGRRNGMPHAKEAKDAEGKMGREVGLEKRCSFAALASFA